MQGHRRRDPSPASGRLPRSRIRPAELRGAGRARGLASGEVAYARAAPYARVGVPSYEVHRSSCRSCWPMRSDTTRLRSTAAALAFARTMGACTTDGPSPRGARARAVRTRLRRAVQASRRRPARLARAKAPHARAGRVPGDARAEFDDGSSRTADLLVGADGVHSVVRHTVRPSSTLHRSEIGVWRGIAPIGEDVVPTGLHLRVMAPASLFGVAWVSDELVRWYAAARFLERRPSSPTRVQAERPRRVRRLAIARHRCPGPHL